MSGLTSRASFYKPASGENINVTTDINDNLDKLDTNLNFRVAASETARHAISPFWEGLCVRDTDTGRTWVTNGSAPSSGSWSQIPNSGSTYDADLDLTSGKQLNIGTSGSTANIAVLNTTAATDMISGRVTGDTMSRVLMDTDGGISWGPGGASALDTSLARTDVGELTTGDDFVVTGDLTVGGIGQTRHVYKVSDQSKTNSTLASDNELTFTVVPGTYHVKFMILVKSTSATPDFKTNWSVPASTSVLRSCIGPTENSATFTSRMDTNGKFQASGATTDVTYQIDSSGNTHAICEESVMLITVSGSVTLQWAQNTTNATATTVSAGSWALCTRYA